MSKPYIEKLINVGSLYGIFFFLQAYGYTYGYEGGSEDYSTNQAIAFGLKHLYNIFRPWENLGWPLIPFLCACLLVYTIFLPQLFQSDFKIIMNRLYFSAFFAVTVTAILHPLLGTDASIIIIKSVLVFKSCPICLSSTYLLIIVLLGGFSFRYLFKENSTILSNFKNEPWSELVTTILLGWILFLVYIGSILDGAIDKRIFNI